MVAAVYFDRDSVLIADEVRYERAEGLLALEVKSREPPKVTFGIISEPIGSSSRTTRLREGACSAAGSTRASAGVVGYPHPGARG